MEPKARIQSRISSIDIVRGAVMVLMAIDHVRVYSGLPAGGPTAGIFFTRWVTHFCAPVFAFFAGTGAYLYGRKIGASALARFLVCRGLLLVLLELTVIRFAWTYNFHYAQFTLAGVIWMLGWSMVLLAGMLRLRASMVGTIGLAIVFLQKGFALVTYSGPAWEFIYPAGNKPWPAISILYVIVPWVGVMAAGYGFGAILQREEAQRRKWCLAIGLTATAMFLAIGSYLMRAAPTLFRLLNQQKYPASPLFLMMTLGPAIAFLPLAERATGWFARVLATFGRVPMFYYLAHIFAIHSAALMVMFLREGTLHPEWYAGAPYTWMPEGHRWTLPLLYLIWAVVVIALYFPCRWFAGLKERRRDSWLRYI
jgi:uncharacterized membrane protein